MSVLHEEKASELTERQPTMDDVRRGFWYRSGEFDCLTIREAVIIHCIAVDEGWLLVCGHPEWGDYEWISVACSGKCFIDKPFEPRLERDEVWEHSNAGWGSCSAALLDGLLKLQGASCCECGCCVLPEDIAIRCPDCTQKGRASDEVDSLTEGATAS